ncbi:MAG: hypothetical protein H6594_10210 [Flavobacteriales bacterium]|nr:hypothetical protein [Flavobacteriales bacterium]
MQNGDTVDILAGTYAADVTNWTADDAFCAVLADSAPALASNGLSWGDKAIWVIQEQVAPPPWRWMGIRRCTSRSHSSAGIRQEGHDLTVRAIAGSRQREQHPGRHGEPNNITIEVLRVRAHSYGDGYSL